MKIPKQFYFLLAVAAGASWGTHGTFTYLLAQYGINDNAIALICPLTYGLFFLILTVKDDFRHLILPKKWIPLFLLYGFVAAGFSLSSTKAYMHLPVGIVHTVVFCNLFLIMLFSRWLFKTPIKKENIFCAIVAVIGIAFMLNIFGNGMNLNFIGILWTLAALVFWATLVTIEKYFLNIGLNGNALLTFSGLFAVIFISFLSPPWETVSDIIGAVIQSGGTALVPLAGFILIPSIASYAFYLKALTRMDPTLTQLGYVGDPLTATILGVILFGQSLLPIQMIGIVLILCVVIFVEVRDFRSAKKASA